MRHVVADVTVSPTLLTETTELLSAHEVVEKTTYTDHPLSHDVLASELVMKLAALTPGECFVLIVKHGGKAAS